MMLRLTFLLLTISAALPALAGVNTRNGSFNDSWIDFIDPSDGYEMKIERFYSSRSLYLGVFGYGWCTEFESKITVTSDGILNLTECGGGLEITYYPEKFDLHSEEQTIDKIVDLFKEDKKLSTNDIKNLRTQLSSNTKMRFEYANRLHLVDVKKVRKLKNRFQAKARGFEHIDFDGSFYYRKSVSGRVEKYNDRGQLVQITNPTGAWLKINYKGKKISFLSDQKGRRINFSYDTSGNLQRVFNGRGLETRYEFSGENIVKVHNMWKRTYEFEYDPNHNLTSVKFPDKTAMVMTYDQGNDWIKSYTNRKNCREEYDFLLAKDDPKNHYWGTFSKKCPNKTAIEGRHEFWYKNYSFSQDKYLHRVQENYPDKFRNIYFHPYIGRPVSVQEPTTYNGYAYYLNGLVNKREFKRYGERRQVTEWFKDAYKYNLTSLKMTEARKTILNKNGKTKKRKKIEFSYDKRGLLRKATTKAKQFVSIDYSQAGKIRSLKNQDNVTIELVYKMGREKPSVIKQMGVGQVDITYDSEDKVVAVETNSKRQVASSVIETFLRMIDFLGPMAEALKI